VALKDHVPADEVGTESPYPAVGVPGGLAEVVTI